MTKFKGIDIGALLEKLDKLVSSADDIMTCTEFKLIVNKAITDHLNENENGKDKGDVSQLYSVMLAMMKLARGGHLGYEYTVIIDQFISVLTDRLERYQHLSKQVH